MLEAALIVGEIEVGNDLDNTDLADDENRSERVVCPLALHIIDS